MYFKRALFSLFLLTASVFAFSFDFKNVEQSVQADVSYAANKGIEHNIFLFSAEYEADWKILDAEAGIQFSPDVFDFAVKADFFPTPFKIDLERIFLSFGFNAAYHLQAQYDIAIENDVNLTTCLKLGNYKGFEFRALFGYGFKITDIFELRSNYGSLWDNNFVVGFFVSKTFSNGLGIYYNVKNYNMYRFYLIDNPIHTFGANYRFGKFRAGGEVELKFTDQFKSTPCMTGLWFRLSMRYYL